jgi:protein-disulfide isomerase
MVSPDPRLIFWSLAMSLPRFAAASLGAAFLALAAIAPARAEMNATQKTEIEAVIKDYLLNNPEVLRDALNEMDRRQKAEETAARAKAVSDAAPLIFNSPKQAVLGNPNGKVTLVEFFDYNCGYCKKSLDDITQLVKEDKDLRLVIKDFPVLGPGSVEAAEIATALRKQFTGDKYWQFHTKLLGMKGQIGKAQANAVAKEMGADMDRLAKDTASPDTKDSIQEVMKIADGLQLTGTPTFVLGDDVVVGAVGHDELKSRIDNVKKCGKVACG